LYKTYNPDTCTSLGVFRVGTFEGVRRISSHRPCCPTSIGKARTQLFSGAAAERNGWLAGWCEFRTKVRNPARHRGHAPTTTTITLILPLTLYLTLSLTVMLTKTQSLTLSH